MFIRVWISILKYNICSIYNSDLCVKQMGLLPYALQRAYTRCINECGTAHCGESPPDSKVCVVANTVNFEGNLPQYQKTMAGYSLLET